MCRVSSEYALFKLIQFYDCDDGDDALLFAKRHYRFIHLIV